MLRLDSATLEHSSKRFVGVAEGVCAITLNRNEPIMCEHAQSLKQPFLAVRRCKGAITSEVINVSLDGTSITWSPNLHLRLLHLWRESGEFRSSFPGSEAAAGRKTAKPKRTLDLLATGGIALTIDISPQHFLELSSDQLRCSNGEWTLNFLRMALDMCEIINIEGFELLRLRDSQEVRIERQNNEGFELEWNETWMCIIESAKARFPYEHQFTDAIQNELFSIRKWLKEIHSSGGPKEKPVPSDLVIKVNTRSPTIFTNVPKINNVFLPISMEFK